MISAAKFHRRVGDIAGAGVRGGAQRAYRRLAESHILVKWFVILASIAAVGYIDLSSGDELSFSIFYLPSIALATWFIGLSAGIQAAIISALIWFSVDATFRTAYSNAFIPVWNGVMRLMFFWVAVFAIAMVKRTEAQLLREVLGRTRSLREEAERRRRLEREILEVSAREHVRMAHDLHDGLGQYLSAMSFHAQILADDLRLHASPHLSQAERLVSLIRMTNRITRQLDRALRVPEAGQGDFSKAIQPLLADLEQLTGVRCEFAAPEQALVLDAFRTVMLFRIVQEALNNAVKHANPRLIRVDLSLANEVLTVVVLDDGQGLATQPEREPGTGMRGMRLRADLIGGRLDFGSGAGGGWRVQCVLPLAPQVSLPAAK
jgi:signal transduction histidine kinase